MEDKKKIKTFGKVLYVLATIARVCLGIATVLLVLFAIVVPIIFSKVEIEKNRVAIVGIPDARVEIYKDKTEKLNIVVNDKKVDVSKELTSTEQLAASSVFDMLSDTTKEAVVIYLEGSIILGIVTLVLTMLALKNFGKFGKNLGDKDEVFEKDNSKYLRNTAKFMLISYIVSLVVSGALNGALADEFDFNINTIGIVEILVLYMLSYVFNYGHTIEAKKVEVIETKEDKPKTTRQRKTTKKEEK
jgi:hypothetical protein